MSLQEIASRISGFAHSTSLSAWACVRRGAIERLGATASALHSLSHSSTPYGTFGLLPSVSGSLRYCGTLDRLALLCNNDALFRIRQVIWRLWNFVQSSYHLCF